MNELARNPDLWLVRTAENFIAGPYSQDQVRQLMREGQLGLQDEVSPANHYWIHLHERDEVAKLLGSDVLQWIGPEAEREDVTLTQTEPGISDAEAEREATVSAIRAIEAGIDEEQSTLAQAKETPLTQPPRSPGQSSEPLIHVSPSAESGPRWGLWLLLLLLLGILVAVVVTQVPGLHL